MAEDDNQRKAAEEYFSKLSPDERRERFFLRPAYRTARDRILDSEDRTTFPRYTLTKWVPVLGAQAFTLWLVMRDMARVEAAHADSWCWPDQENLGAKIGVSGNTLRKLIGVLERHGFIRRVRRREPVNGRWGQMQRNNSYAVFLDLPLVDVDAVSCLVEELTEEANRAEFNPSTHSYGRGGDALTSRPAVKDAPLVDNALTSRTAVRDADLKKCGQGDEGFRELSSADLKTCALNVSNVDNLTNVEQVRSGRTPLREHPAVKVLSGPEKRERARLALEIGETLLRMSGIRDGRAHPSLGFHRRVAFLMPVSLVQKAIRCTRDAVEARNSGRGGVRQDPSKYFGGIVKQLAVENGINLGLKTTSQRGVGAQRPKRQTTPRAVEPEQSPEERARMIEAMRKLAEDLESKPAGPDPDDA